MPWSAKAVRRPSPAQTAAFTGLPPIRPPVDDDLNVRITLVVFGAQILRLVRKVHLTLKHVPNFGVERIKICFRCKIEM
jgi:hypothetical protein